MRPVPVAVTVQWSVAVLLTAFLMWFVGASLHWPLVGDANLMHYIVMLIERGMVPYRDIGDMNFPGAYLPDWIALHMPGPPALVWRAYDLLLLLLGGAAIATLARPASWLAGFWAAALFALMHGQDGIYQVGQRDLAIAVLLLAGTAVLLRGNLLPYHGSDAFFGLCTGVAATIKPTALPFLLCLMPMLRQEHSQSHNRLLHRAGAVLCGCALPLALVFGWLHRYQALSAFLHAETTLAPLHASLGKRPLLYLLQHSVSPLLPLLAAWLLLLVLNQLDGPVRTGMTQRHVLLLGALLGCLAYVVQGKGYPYQRYTVLGFLLPLIAHDLDRLMRRADGTALSRYTRRLALAVFAVCAVLIGGVSVWHIGRFEWRAEEFRATLEADLAALAPGHRVEQLSRRIQCLDSISGCTEVLNYLGLLPSTGILYDEFLFHPAGTAAVDESRRQFWAAVQQTPPMIFIMTEPLFPDGPNGYRKLEQWPEFAKWLEANYRVAIERKEMRTARMGGAATHPSGYRIYVRRA